jgi:hypothetical protein
MAKAVRSSSTSNLNHDSEGVGIILSRIAIALLIVFAAVVISSILPPRVLNPAWQLRFVAAFINNGTLAVLGMVLVWISSVLNPGNGRLRARRDQVASLAAAVAIGYLLLIPLQISAAWKGVNTADTARSSQLKVGQRRVQLLRQAIQQARTSPELQERLRALNGPSLPPQELAKPIEVIRPQILAGLESAESRLRQQLGGLPPDRLWQLAQESVRVVISALAYAFGYAAAAFLPGRSQSLLDGALGRFRKPFRHMPAGAGASGRRSVVSGEDYLRELSREESSEPNPKP